MQLALFSALAMAFACFIWMKNKEGPNLNAITQEAVKEARKKEEKAKKGNAVTLQSLRILGVPYTRYRVLSFVFGFLAAFAWLTIAQNYVAAIVMYAVGFQLPGLYYERKASSLLDAQDRQVAIFVGTTADGLANGRTINEALWQAALLMREEPMHSIAQNYLKRIGGNVSIADAVADMAKEVNTPSFLFFADLVATVKNVGTDGNNSFEVLDYKFHEEEDIQSDMRGEVSIWMGILISFFTISLAGPFIYRIFMPDIWQFVPHNMGWLIILSSIGSLIIFTTLRSYSRYRVTL
ncbi:pilus assembly protein TadB [Desulfosporosinus sp.]|uniref:type II secretion system F family protein n=1 Tax=Desulfosporosinus sp. TaxID=157907 RepID=UPI002620ADA8|nr:pilus assembly protein TadB [Desulfosporosinus sp.]